MKNPQPMISESYYIGKSTNPADNLAKFGRKTLKAEEEVSLTYWIDRYTLDRPKSC